MAFTGIKREFFAARTVIIISALRYHAQCGVDNGTNAPELPRPSEHGDPDED